MCIDTHVVCIRKQADAYRIYVSHIRRAERSHKCFYPEFPRAFHARARTRSRTREELRALFKLKLKVQKVKGQK